MTDNKTNNDNDNKDNADNKSPTDFISNAQRLLAQGMVSFINASPSPYHAVQTAVNILTQSKFTKLDETKIDDQWTDLPPGRYYFTRNQSTIVAFVKPKKWKPGNGFTIMGAHTDSPAFKVKPVSKNTKENFLMVGVEKYGGGLWHTWFDRDLSVAGRVIIQNPDNNTFSSRLVRINDPILRISNLAIHLDRSVRDGFKFCTEDHTVPIFASAACAQFNQSMCGQNSSNLASDHHSLLLHLIAKQLNVNVNNIYDFELYLYDTHKSCIGGGLKEFIYSARLDNLCSTYSIITALINSLNTKSKSIETETNIRMIAAFDNEEVGSSSNRGAASNLLYSTMRRIHGDLNFDAAVQKSILISADMAHAIHPNYASKHESKHKAQIHNGLVIKYNSNQRYATNMISTFHLMQCAKMNNINIQKFVVKNSMPCGSTIGPILSSRCGIRTVDVGVPQLSMHSIREVCGIRDVATSIAIFTSFFENFVKLDASLKVD